MALRHKFHSFSCSHNDKTKTKARILKYNWYMQFPKPSESGCPFTAFEIGNTFQCDITLPNLCWCNSAYALSIDMNVGTSGPGMSLEVLSFLHIKQTAPNYFW